MQEILALEPDGESSCCPERKSYSPACRRQACLVDSRIIEELSAFCSPLSSELTALYIDCHKPIGVGSESVSPSYAAVG